MTPYGFLKAALGACTSMTIRMYARHKKMPLTKVSVDVIHDKVDAPSVAGAKKQDCFSRYVTLEGDLSEAERKKLLEIANKMPRTPHDGKRYPHRYRFGGRKMHKSSPMT